jgi:hypothetical protein
MRSLFASVPRAVPVLVLGLFIASWGLVRLSQTATLPSYRALTTGAAAFAYSALLLSDKRRTQRFQTRYSELLLSERTHLLLVLGFAFFFRSFWFDVSPYPLGSDTPTYLNAVFLLDKDTGNLWGLWKNGMEPLPLLMLLAPYALGAPVSVIPRIIIPLISTATLVPLYYMTRGTARLGVAQTAILLFAASTLQLRLVLDLYRQVVAVFFMMCSLYFLTVEKGRVPWKTVGFSIATVLSHASSFFVLAAVAFLWVMFVDSPQIKRNAVAAGFLLLPMVIGVALLGYWSEWMTIIASRVSSYALDLVSPQYWKISILSQWHITLELFEWTIALIVLAIPSIVKARRNDLYLWFLIGPLGLVALSVISPFGLWRAPDRWGLHLDGPLAVFAARTLSGTSRPRAATAIAFLWIVADSLAFGSLYFRPGVLKSYDG